MNQIELCVCFARAENIERSEERMRSSRFERCKRTIPVSGWVGRVGSGSS